MKNLLKLLLIILGMLITLTSMTDSYFTDSAITEGATITTGYLNKLLINEVYFNVDSTRGDDGDKANPDEWIEFYNPTDKDINLKDWTISDNEISTTINANKVIQAKSYALLSKSASTFKYWNVPKGTLIIELGQKIGDGLDNLGDRLIFKDPEGNIVDEISYGDDSIVFTLPITTTERVYSLTRLLGKKDSDQATDWKINIPPTPGE